MSVVGTLFHVVLTASPARAVDPPTGVSLSASASVVRSDETFTLTATANGSVTGTGASIQIYAQASGVRYAQCSSGSTCTSPTQTWASANQSYIAYVGSASSTAPPASVYATSSVVTVDRALWSVALDTTATVLRTDETASLTATANQPMAATNLRIMIFNTAGARYATCATGTTCTATIPWSSTSYSFVAYVASASSTAPPPNLQATSNTVTIGPASWSVTLASDRADVLNGENAVLTATANQPLGASSYSIQIFDSASGARYATCASGATCTANINWANANRTFIAYVGSSTSTPPPATTVATSNTMTINRAAFSLGLTADRSEVKSNETAVVTATANQSVSNTGVLIQIYRVATGARIASCSTGAVCSASVTWANANNAYVAYVGASSPSAPPTSPQATSNTVTVSRAAWTLTLVTDRTWLATGESATLTATANQPLDGTGYGIHVYHATTGVRLASCATTSACQVTAGWASSAQEYVAYVGVGNNQLPFPSPLAESNRVTITPQPWTIELTVSHWPVLPDTSVTMTASTNQSVSGSPYAIVIEDLTAGTVLAACGLGDSCAVSLTASWPARLYGAYVAAPGPEIIARSNTFHLPTSYDIDGNFGNPDNAPGVGDPVHPATGNFYDGVLDIPFPRSVPDLGFGRMYNSRDLRSGPLGRGWSSTFTASLDVDSMGNAVLRGDDGRARFFTASPTGHIAPAGFPAALAALPDGTWQLTYAKGGGLTFDVHGDLTRVTNRNGTYADVSYTNGRVSQVSSSVGGRTLTWAYNAGGRIETVTADDGRTVQFGYTGNLLTSSTAVDGGVTTYTYDANGFLATIVDGDGRTDVASAYDALGRVVSQASPHGQTLTFSYSDDATRSTVVTGLTSGEATTLRFDPQARLIEIVDATTHTATKSYVGGYLAGSVDRKQNAFSQVVDANGNITSRTFPGGSESYGHDAANRLVSFTDAEDNTTTFAYSGSDTVPSLITWPDDTTTTQVVEDNLVTHVADADGVHTDYDYDAAHNLVKITDGLGNETTMTYDDAGRMLTRTSAELRTTTWTYDAAGRVVTETDGAGGVTTHTYDHDGNVLTTTDPDDGVTEFTYDNAAQLTAVEHPDGTTTTYGYDDRGNLLTETQPGGAVTTYTYGVLDRLASMTDPEGVATTYSYDANGRVTARTNEAGDSRSTTYDAFGRVLTSTDELGRTTTYVRDGLGRVTSVTDGASAETTTTYDSLGRVATVTDPLDRTTTKQYTPGGRLYRVVNADGTFREFAYDGAGRQVVATDPGDGDTLYGYDDDGLLAGSTTPAGLIFAYTYDGAGRVLTSDAPGVGVTTTTYTPGGRVESESVPGKGTVEFTYDPMGRVVTATDANDHVTTYTYDVRGNRTGALDANDHTWSWEHDLADRVTSATDPLGRSTSTTYDALGRVSTVADQSGRSRTYTYDDASQISRVTFGDASFVDFTYDGAGRRLTATDATGVETNTYDLAGHLLSNSYGGRTVGYTYDLLDRVKTITYPGGAVVTNTFTPNGELVGVARSGGGTATYTYDDDGRVLTETLPGGMTRSYGYTSGQLTSYTESSPGSTTTSAITRGAGAKVATVTTAGATTSYGYDTAGQLTSVDAPGTADDVSYSYDSVGNMVGRTTGGVPTTMTFDAADQLATSVTSGVATTFAYDSAGRLVSSADGTTTVTTAYDARGRTSAVTVAAGPLAPSTTRERAYTPTDRLAGVTTEETVLSLLGTSTTTSTAALTWDVARRIPEVLSVTTNGVASDIVYGVGKAFANPSGAAASAPFSRDAFGSLRPTAATSGLVVSGGTAYSPYGDPSGNDPGVAFGYRSELHVGDRLHLRAREHDPLAGRFATRDPLDGSPGEPVATNPYHYGGNDPVNAVDPSGLSPAITDPYLNGVAVGLGPAAGAGVAVVPCTVFLAQPATAGVARSSVTPEYLACVAAVATAAAAGAAVIDDVDVPTRSSASTDDEPQPRPKPTPVVTLPPLPVDTKTGARIPIVLHHYTESHILPAILTSQVLLPSTRPGPRSRYGTGQYFTDLSPTKMARGTRPDASTALFSSAKVQQKLTHFISINIKGLPVVRVSSVYPTKSYGSSYGIYVHPSTAPLPIAGRVVVAGPVPWT